MMGRLNRDQEQFFYSFRLDEAVPDDHPVREIAAVLDLSWVHSELAPFYPRLGRPSIDPVLMIRMLIVGYVFAIRSERALCRDVRVNLAYRWFCGLSIEDKVPDHSKQPWYFTARDGSPALTVAGLWDEWRDEVSGETLKSCTMIITEPNEFVAKVHDRMPVLLAEKDFEPWLSGSAGLELHKPAAEDLLQRWPVSKRVNSSRAPDNDPTLTERMN